MIDNFLSFSRYFKGDCYTASSANYKIRQCGESVENYPKKVSLRIYDNEILALFTSYQAYQA